jgi:hypothetical protein
MTDQQQSDDDTGGAAAVAFEAYVAELVAQLVDARSMAHLDECTAIWKQMTLEARGLTPKQAYLDRCQVYKSQIQGKKMALERSEVMMGGSGSTTATTMTTTASTESKLVQQNVVLDQAMKSLHETEDLAGEIASNLHSNRTTIQNAKTNTQTVSSLTNRAHQIADQLLKPWWKQAWSK